MSWPDAVEVPIPGEYLGLPNPRGFRPVAIPILDFQPNVALLPTPLDADQWPTGEPFEHRIPMRDAVELRARICLPTTNQLAPWVLLLHMWGMDADSWERRAPGFLDELTEMERAWCAIDLRWHGQSGDEPHCAVYDDWRLARQLPMPGKAERLGALAQQGPPLGANVLFLRDIADIHAYLAASRRVADPWAICGASVGANAAWVASSLCNAKTHICISPYYPSPGWTLMGREVDPFIPRDVLFVSDDEEAAEAERMAQQTSGSVARVVGVGKEHGIGLLRQPPIRRRVLEALRRM